MDAFNRMPLIEYFLLLDRKILEVTQANKQMKNRK